MNLLDAEEPRWCPPYPASSRRSPVSRRRKIKKGLIQICDLVALYTVQHLTLREIGEKVGLSHTHVSRRLQKAGIKAKDGERVSTNCAECGKPIVALRARWRNQHGVFCNKVCFVAYLANPHYIESRQGSRIARTVVACYFDLQSEHIVHHEDTNQSNNDPINLKVFASQSDHLKYHHGKTPVTPLWDGAVVAQT